VIAALGRAGYQNLRYPGSPAATFAGATWLAGGRLGTVGPDQPAYVSLQYGKQQGVYGITGSSQVNITPSMVFFRETRFRGSPRRGSSSHPNLATSTLSPSGGIVNQSTGLPIALSSPGLGISNNVYRQHLYSAGLTELAAAQLLFALRILHRAAVAVDACQRSHQEPRHKFHILARY